MRGRSTVPAPPPLYSADGPAVRGGSAATVWESLERAARAGSTLRVPDTGCTLPLPALYERAGRTAGLLLGALRREPPWRVGLLMANGEPWIRGMLAGLRIAAAVVPLPLPAAFGDPGSYLTHVRRLGEDARLDLILTDDSVRRVAPVLETALPDTQVVDITSPPTRAPRDLPDPGGQSLAFVQYTSGSTAAPKGVALTHANVLAGLTAIAEGTTWHPDDVMGLWVPLFHDMGLFLALSSLLQGSSLCLWRPSSFVRDPAAWLRGFAASGATITAAPDFAYDRMAEASSGIAPGELDLSRWRLALNGGEPVRHGTVTRFREALAPHGVRAGVMRPAYGLAEATLAVTMPDPAAPVCIVHAARSSLGEGDRVRFTADRSGSRPLVSVGKAVTGMDLRLAGSHGPVADGVVAEIQVRGHAVTAGYLGMPADRQPVTRDGWWRTGDLGFRHCGELYITGRRKDMAIVRGRNVYAEDVEDVARSVPGVHRRHCAAFAAEDGCDESVLVLFETSLPLGEAWCVADRIRAAVFAACGLAAVRAVPLPPRTIPYTTSGKVQRRAARLLWKQHDLCRPRRGWHTRER